MAHFKEEGENPGKLQKHIRKLSEQLYRNVSTSSPCSFRMSVHLSLSRSVLTSLLTSLSSLHLAVPCEQISLFFSLLLLCCTLLIKHCVSAKYLTTDALDMDVSVRTKGLFIELLSICREAWLDTTSMINTGIFTAACHHCSFALFIPCKS